MVSKIVSQIDRNPDPTFRFIDLFAGIGGCRLGFERAGGECVFTSEWDRFARQTYETNYPTDEGSEHVFAGDIREVTASEVPDHDVLVGGFPCQPFSIAGVSKKNALGRPHGFQDPTQGTLFFDVARIIAEKRPRAFVLENVRNLVSHDKGNTFKVIRAKLEDELGYEFHSIVIDASRVVPQGRRRIFMVGFDKRVFPNGSGFTFEDFELDGDSPTMESVLHREDGSEAPHLPYTDAVGQVAQKYTLTPGLWQYLQNYKKKHSAAGNGFGFGLVTRNDVARTLSARYYKDGSEILVDQGTDSRPRRLTPRECARLMGFPDTFEIPVSDTQAYKQFGNSVVVPVVEAVATRVAEVLAAQTREVAAAG
ncbi:DNA (cytosine-5)-methyltransferase 1 [Nocardioides exalbidus]|uniref:Cytosine-specific methyltransferase n=1 Tax=Nocardioides exalbidus TaxID=402596 RepID=A0A1H4KQA1_9ACTN|nr:DNA (cytosine-5-)-methyltransferase [Nocardioides exalbidus]SEB60749.1 DNA (cytosine-5)-methyltransferase 1 [Nocardioides exalbidus]